MAEFNQQQAFLFMPDISGFTKFINETEIEHSTHIIQELLEIIVNANEINLELLEIEGDAVFFFRLGKMPAAAEIIQQTKKIFEKFHQHLLKYESHRLCQCGACRTASNLTLKFIIHAGPVGSFNVGNNFKLIGKDIIILHRLLKNCIPLSEYFLFTEPFFGILESEKLIGQNLSAINEAEEFDNVLLHYKYVPIQHWLQDIEMPTEGNAVIQPKLVPVITVSKKINSEAGILFSYLADLSKRTEWMNGVKKIEFSSNEKINQVGTVHKCIIENNSLTQFKTNYFEHRDDEYSMMEIDAKKNAFGHKFIVEQIDEESSMVTIQFLVKNNPIHKTMFSLFMKNKMKKNLEKSMENLGLKFKTGMLK